MLLLFALLFSATVLGQKDTILLKNKDIIVGEIKSLNKGILVVETDYSHKDFNIEWSEVLRISSSTRFLLMEKSGRRLNGVIRAVPDSSGRVVIEDGGAIHDSTTLDGIVFLKGLKSDFWSRVYAKIDIGSSVTRANNLRSVTGNLSLGYIADQWTLDTYFNSLYSTQDSVDAIKRFDAGVSYNYFLQRDWYLLASLQWLSNTEQALKLRSTLKAGIGKYVIHTNRAYWGFAAGLSALNESFYSGKEARNSAEFYTGTEANLFDIGDFSFLGSVYGYLSLTESGRFRSDIKLDAKYDFPKDFYLRFNVTLNYDNQPAAKGSELDYVYGLTVGWKL